jgi:hypothetical protein
MKIPQLFFALGLIASAALAHGEGDPLKVKPVAVMQGADTLINHPMVRMIKTKQQWSELWAMHKGGAVAKPAADPKAPVTDEKGVPIVDFDKNQVLVVFGGKLVNVQAYDYVKTVDDHGTAIVQLAPNNVPAGTNDAIMLPYILLVIPQEPVPIQVDLDTVGKDGQHFWNKIAAFRAPAAKKGS